jgi:hypothetical protein
MLALKKNYSEVSWLCHLLYKRPHIARTGRCTEVFFPSI